MASSDPELKDGFTLPVWMKTKPSKDFESFAASPPELEDAFFYIRYPKTDLLGKQKIDQNTTTTLVNKPKDFSTSAINAVQDKDWSKHTKPCRDALNGISTTNDNLANIKSSTDKELKGAAACGSSILQVAQQMVTNRSSRGYTVAAPADDPADDPQQYHGLHTRRGSKSLPSTPAHSPTSSPTSRRKKVGNRYFTSPFEPVEDANNRSWIATALLGLKKDLTTSTSTLAEEDAVENIYQGGSLAESVENLGPAPKNKEVKSSTQAPKVTTAFRPKPSELREMNFWSPTSM